MAVAVESGDLEGAHSYRSLALQLLKHDRPMMLAIGGLSGVGKSALAREVAPFLPGGVGARIIRSDVVRKRSLGIGVESQADRGAYAPERRAATYREMLAYAAAAAGAGASVVVDATFQAEGMRETLAAALPAARRIWLEAPLELRLARVGARVSDASDADVSVAVAQEAIIDPGPDWERVDAGRPLADIAEAVLKGSQ
jgi:predicted kinase